MRLAILTLAGLMIAGTASAQRAETISIVGSSTVFPFSTKVAETFGETTDFNTPVIESTGSGGGMKLFCAGVGTDHPDITNASRAMKSGEAETCAANGVEFTEFVIGFDGIVVANSNTTGVVALTPCPALLFMERGRYLAIANLKLRTGRRPTETSYGLCVRRWGWPLGCIS